MIKKNRSKKNIFFVAKFYFEQKKSAPIWENPKFPSATKIYFLLKEISDFPRKFPDFFFKIKFRHEIFLFSIDFFYHQTLEIYFPTLLTRTSRSACGWNDVYFKFPKIGKNTKYHFSVDHMMWLVWRVGFGAARGFMRISTGRPRSSGMFLSLKPYSLSIFPGNVLTESWKK